MWRGKRGEDDFCDMAYFHGGSGDDPVPGRLRERGRESDMQTPMRFTLRQRASLLKRMILYITTLPLVFGVESVVDRSRLRNQIPRLDDGQPQEIQFFCWLIDPYLVHGTL
jgi:hypothetical protein